MSLPAPPASSRARAEPDSDGVTIDLPAQGVLRYWPDWLWCGALAVGLVAFAWLAVAHLARARGWLDWLTWGGGLLLCLLVLRPVSVLVSQRLLERSLGRGTLVASGGRLYLHRRSLLRGRERVWDVGAIAALDEEDGALCVLASGVARLYFAGRDPEELRWVAALLRDKLRVPASPPPMPGEVAVTYRLSEWPEARPGFVLIEPGQLMLRPRFSLTTGLVLRPAGQARGDWSGRLLDGLGAGRLAVRPEDMRWGVAEGGGRVLRVWLYEEEAAEPAELSIASLHEAEFAALVERFWQANEGS